MRFFTPLRLDAAASSTIVHRGVLSLAGTVLQSTSRVVTNLIIGRIGGPVVLGVVASAISTAQLLALLWPSATGGAASKFVARARGEQDFVQVAAVAAHLGKRSLQATLLLACAGAAAWMLLDGAGPTEGLYVALLVVGYSGYSFTRGLHFGAGQVGRATRWDLIASVLGMSGVLVSLSLGVRGLELLMPLAAAALLYTLAGWPWGAHGHLGSDLRREIDGFVLITTLGTIASAGFLQLSMIAARRAGGAGGAGQYAAALTVATPLAIIASSLSLVLYPSMSAAFGRGDRQGFRRQADQAMRFLTLIMVAAIASLAICSRSVIALVWGEQYEPAADLLPILLAAVLATALAVPSSNALTSGGRAGVSTATYASLLGFSVGVSIWLLTAPSWDVTGIALGYLGGATVTMMTVAARVWNREQQRWGGLILRVTTAMAVLGLLLAAQRSATLPQWSDPLLALAFCAGWLSCSYPDLRLASALVRERLGRRDH